MSMTTFVHDSPEWHDMRARHIGSSEISALFDLAPEDTPGYAKSRFSLWHIKAGNAPPLFVDNPRVRWGTRLESLIAEAAAEENGWSVQKGGYFTDAHCEGVGASLDYIIDFDPAEKGPGVLEIKNVDWLVHKRSWDTEPPPHILLQLMHQLAATGYSWGAVCCLISGNDLRTYRYKARPLLIEDIRRKVREFWRSIDEGKEPPVDGSESASAVLKALHPTVADDAIDMRDNNEWAEAAHGFYMAGDARRDANDAYELAKNRVVHLLNGHKRGWGNGWQVNTSITPENPGRPPKPGELVGKRAEVRKYSVKEMEIKS
jgi:predicted phage-related endonuclease